MKWMNDLMMRVSKKKRKTSLEKYKDNTRGDRKQDDFLSYIDPVSPSYNSYSGGGCSSSSSSSSDSGSSGSSCD